MSKALKTIGVVAGAVALVATGVGVAAGIGLATTIGTYASLAAGAANLGASLTQKKPPARGAVTQLLIQVDAPTPYAMGEGLVGGVLRHEAGYGTTLKKVPNPYLGQVVVYSHGGPVQSLTPYVDKAPIGGWYAGFLYTSSQLGLCPQASALAPHFAGFPGWTASSKLSGQAAILWNYLFDKDGKVFASGRPPTAAYGQWVKVYDPRLDSTYPGGSGPQRVDDEATWAWSENPGLHGLTYALGRHQNGKFVLGMDLAPGDIEIGDFVELANVCDANGWRMFGVVYEPGEREVRWTNLKDIVGAGGAEPFIAAGKLRLKVRAPKTALATLTPADLADGRIEVTAMQTLADRVNSIVPKFRSPDHDWEMIDAEAVTVADYVDEDGELIERAVPYNFVKDVDQAAELAAYDLVDGRELGPITGVFGAAARGWRPGDCLHLDFPDQGLDSDAILLTRELDPATLQVTLTFVGETPAKHAFALGEAGAAPPSPALGQTGQQRDELIAAASDPIGYAALAIRSAATKNPRDASNVPRAMLTASESAGVATISVARHDWDYPTGTADVTRETDTIGGLTPNTYYYVYFDDATLADTAPAYAVTTDPAAALNSADHPDRHPLGEIVTPAGGAGATSGGNNVGYGFDFAFYF
jgi:hypothetical protein